MCFISDSDDDFESPSKLFRTSDIKQASTSPSYNPIQQPKTLQDQSLHGPCSAQFASFEYKLAKVEADLVESEQLSCILKDKEKETKLVRVQKTKLEEETRQVFKCLICNITAKLPLTISPCCKIVFGCNTVHQGINFHNLHVFWCMCTPKRLFCSASSALPFIYAIFECCFNVFCESAY